MKTFKTFMAAAMFASAMIIALPSAAQSDLTKKEKNHSSVFLSQHITKNSPLNQPLEAFALVNMKRMENRILN